MDLIRLLHVACLGHLENLHNMSPGRCPPGEKKKELFNHEGLHFYEGSGRPLTHDVTRVGTAGHGAERPPMVNPPGM